MSRDRLVAFLWPESGSESARHSLEQLLYLLRRQVNEGLFAGNDPIRLNPQVITCDASDFERAVARGAIDEAIALYQGPFLDGFYLSSAGDFQEWVEAERARLANAYAQALIRQAERFTQNGECEAAVTVWRKLVALDSMSSRNVLGLVRSLAESGDRAGALRAAHTYETMVREELDISPEPELLAFIVGLRAEPKPALAVTTSTLEETVFVPVAVEAAKPSAQLHAAVASGRRRSWPLAIALLAIAVAGFIGFFKADSPATTIDRESVIVLPFRVTGADSSLNHLREGMVELLALKLTGEGGPRAIDPTTTFASWRKLGTVNREPTLLEVSRMAASLHAGRVLAGAAIGNKDHLTLTASLYSAADTSAALHATVSGPLDSISSLADQLAGQLLGDDAGVGPELASLTPLAALRAYLEGRSAYREGRWSDAALQFDRALTIDSTLAPAAIGLSRAAGWLDGSNGLNIVRAERLAFDFRERLNPRDRGLLLAELGENYPARPSSPERLRSLRAIVDMDPNFAEAWHRLGDIYFRLGSTLGIPKPFAEAKIAFERALDADSVAAGDVLEHLLEIAAVTADTALLRRVTPFAKARERPDIVDAWYQWLNAFTARDGAALQAFPAFGQLSPGQLRFVLKLTQLTGYALQDAVQAERMLSAPVPKTLMDRSTVSGSGYRLALNRGRPREAHLATPGLLLEWDVLSRLSFQLLSALYDDGDREIVSTAIAALRQRANAPIPPQQRAGQHQLEASCVLQQWLLAHGDTSTARVAIALLRTADSIPNGWDVEFRNCGALLDGWLAVRTAAPDARQRIERLDSLTRAGAGWTWIMPSYRLMSGLWETQGEPALALAAIRRRNNHRMEHLATDLRLEGRLAAMTGDTIGSIRAYRHYLALRFDPEPALKPQADSVRAELTKLIRQ